MFKIGDKIKLIHYTKWFDYMTHVNQEAIIISIKKINEFDYSIKWNDGTVSFASFSNIKLSKKEKKIYGIVKFMEETSILK